VDQFDEKQSGAQSGGGTSKTAAAEESPARTPDASDNPARAIKASNAMIFICSPFDGLHASAWRTQPSHTRRKSWREVSD
jgi:hypothetical protein